MTDSSQSRTHVRSALFVDFDNIYLGLQNEDPRAAEQFATHPGRWLRWLQADLPTDSPLPRKILSRRSYLNPSQFSRFRPYFIRSAFEVVDCPPLTRGGKTSADIQMVMDIMDALGHVTRFDEFIILSGDADFTPVLLRLSRFDRRSVVLAAGPASAAYKAACDLLIDQDTFLEEAIGITDGSPVRPGTGSELLQRIAGKVYERASASGELIATDLPSIFREFPEFTPDSNWLGFYSLRGMTSAVVHARQDLEMLEGDPWRVRVRTDLAGLPRPEGEDAAASEVGGSAGVGVSGGVVGSGGSAGPAGTAGNGGRAALAPAAGGVGAAGANGTSERPGLPSAALLRSIADKVYARTSAAGELLATDLPGIYREFPQFTPNSNWLGYYSLRGLSDAVIRSRGDLEMVDGDPWRVRLRAPRPGEAGESAPAGGAAAPSEADSPGATLPGDFVPDAGDPAHGTGAPSGAAGADPATAGTEGGDAAAADGAMLAGSAGAGGAAAGGAPPEAADLERQRQVDTLVEYVRGLVQGSDSPMPVARAAQAAIARFGDGLIASRWYGANTFRDLLGGHGDLGFTLSSTRPGYLYDPDIHQTPLDAAVEQEIGDPETTSLAHRIHRVTDTPYLAPDEYALVFREIAEEVNEEGYFLTRTSKAVRDRCIEEGAPVARTSVNFILRGITSAGHQFDPGGGNDPHDLANAFLKNVLGLCESAGMPLSDDERQRLATWIVGGLDHDTHLGDRG